MATREAQARWRAKRRVEHEPVPKFCRSVIDWSDLADTAGSSRLALKAADLIEAWRNRAGGQPKTTYELMGFGGGSGLASLPKTEVVRIALRTVARAQAVIDAGEASERAVTAGLDACKRLASSRMVRDVAGEAMLAFIRAQAGVNNPPPPSLVGAGTDNPDDFGDSGTGEQSGAMEPDAR